MHGICNDTKRDWYIRCTGIYRYILWHVGIYRDMYGDVGMYEGERDAG